ncbi:MAG: hypothetical protein M1830_004405 [Pleopsidium flavum]|nr:MAG: hypothetical protein M1830_004405 [Pleopsidium flavum]
MPQLRTYLLIYSSDEDAKEDDSLHDPELWDEENKHRFVGYSGKKDYSCLYWSENHDEECIIDPTDNAGYGLDPVIMYANHQVHDEAAAMSHGENVFTCSVYSFEASKMWQARGLGSRQIRDLYTSLIIKIRLKVIFLIGMKKGFITTQKNLGRACKKLARNRVLKEVKVNFVNPFTGVYTRGATVKGHYPRNQYIGEKVWSRSSYCEVFE